MANEACRLDTRGIIDNYTEQCTVFVTYNLCFCCYEYFIQA